MYFIDRHEAGRRLAEALQHYRGTEAVVYALPRRGVPVGVMVAEELRLPFGLIVVSRIGDPTTPDRAVGAMTETGEMLYNESRRDSLNANWLNWAVMFATRDIERKQYLAETLPRISSTNKVAIVVDDGAATGITLRAAVQALRREKPRQVVVAVPIMTPLARAALREYADQIITLDETNTPIDTITQHYADRHALTDREVGYMIKQYDTFMHVAGGAV